MVLFIMHESLCRWEALSSLYLAYFYRYSITRMCWCAESDTGTVVEGSPQPVSRTQTESTHNESADVRLHRLP